MKPIELIIKALVYGIASSVNGIHNDKEKETYANLKESIQKKFQLKGIAEGEMVLKKFEKKEVVWEAPLKELLSESGADKDNDILQYAQNLLEKSEDFKNDIVNKRVGASEVVTNSQHQTFTMEGEIFQGSVQAEHIEKINQYFALQPESERDLRHRYLAELVSETNHLPWASLDPDYADPKCGESLRLVDIYTALDTTDIERMETEDEVRKHLVRQEEARRLSAQEMINTHAKLVLLGDPGSGKSTLVNFLTYIMAEAGLGKDPERCLERLKKTGPWDHGVLFPVRILLRDFASELSSSSKEGRTDLLLSHLQAVLGSKGLTGFWDYFHKGLLSPRVTYLILFDGLDEVPDPLRKTVVKSIDDFVKRYPHHRYLVTCRIYAYVGKDYQLGGFKQSTLTPFNQEQIESFISAWYHELSQRGRFTLKEAQERASRLKRVALRHDLRGLAERPLLMTVMALLHTFRGQLPEDRVKLYQWTVDLLLQRWEGRFGKEKGVIEILNMPGLKMNDLEAGLYDVAFYVHSGHGASKETADIEKAIVRDRLAPYLNKDFNKAEEFIEYVRERTGLLIRHKPSAYTFPHRTFQEYMAACYLVVGKKDYPGEAAQLVKEDPDRWRIVFILAAGYAARNHRLSQAISSVNMLCPLSIQEAGKLDKSAFHTAEIAAEALLEIGLVGVNRDQCGQVLLVRVRSWLVAAMKADEVLVPKELVAAGNILSKMGDPRFNPEYWYLLDDPHMGFVEVPAGPFMMGSDKKRDLEAYDNELPQHEVTLSAYAIGRYPVTEAQFRAFVKDSGYNAGEEWDRGLDNNPVVNISWDDAQAYCKWLTEKLKDRGWLIRLPTEAEWEKSARGTDGQIYPWSDRPDTNKANYRNAGIAMTSPVGCFPGGESPYGILDMAGNVWEWCSDWFGDYPSHGVSDPEGSPGGSSRINRGGSWINYARHCRSAYRGFVPPGYRSDDLGFRLVRSLL